MLSLNLELSELLHHRDDQLLLCKESGLPHDQYHHQSIGPSQDPVSQDPVSRSNNSCNSNNNSSEGRKFQEAATRPSRAGHSFAPHIQASGPSTPNRTVGTERPDVLAPRGGDFPAKVNDQVNFKKKMSLSYLMNPPHIHEFQTTPRRNGRRTGVIDLTISSESEILNGYEGEDEEEDTLSVRKKDSRVGVVRYPPFSANNPTANSGISNNVSATRYNTRQDITILIQDSLLNTPVDQVLNNFKFGESTETLSMAAFRASCTLPPTPTRNVPCHQSRSGIMSLSPFIPIHSTPHATVSTDLSTLEHTAVATLANLNHVLDPSSNRTSTLTPINNSDLPASTHQSLGTSTRKRSLSGISTSTMTLTQLSKLRASPDTGLERLSERICIGTFLNPGSPTVALPDPVPSPLIPCVEPANPTSHNQENLTNDVVQNATMPPVPSDVYPSPPISPSDDSTSMKLVPKPLVPRTPLPSERPSTQNPQANLLVFANQVYLPLPHISFPVVRASSAPPVFSVSSLSTSPHQRPLSREDFAYRAWVLRSSRSIINSSASPNASQYLVLIRNGNSSNSSHNLATSSTTEENNNKWWGIVKGKEDMEKIRKEIRKVLE